MSRLDMYEKKKAAQRNALIRSGKYTFIELMLLKGTRKRIHGIDVVRPIQSENIDNPGVPDYEFRDGGGRIDFVFDEMKGGNFYELVDTPRNRRFLASHEGEGIWEITDHGIRAEIKKMAEEVTKEVVSKNGQYGYIDKPEEPEKNETASIDTDDKVLEMQRNKRGRKKKGVAIIDDTADS